MEPLFFMTWDGSRVVPKEEVVMVNHPSGFGHSGQNPGVTYTTKTGASVAPVFTPSTPHWWHGGDGYKNVARETATAYLGRPVADP